MHPPRVLTLLPAAALAVTATNVFAESIFTKLSPEACQVLNTYEGGGADMRCPGLDGFDVFLNEGDARTDVDFGAGNDNFESFSAFNGPGETIEWLTRSNGTPYAAILRFLIDVDGRAAQALVVSNIGSDDAPGCVVAVVDAAAEQANGVARGLGALAPLFDCAIDPVVMVPGAGALVREFNGANGTEEPR